MSESTTADRGLLITGFPGFITRRLVDALIPCRPDAQFFLLVQPDFVFEAKKQCQRLESAHPGFEGRWHIVVGDIRRADLGMDKDSAAHVRAATTEVWHLAALYDLTVAQSIAYSVNVDGTEQVLAFARTLSDLRRLNYISTCYVAGDRHGRVYEDELDVGQNFKNHYESTKFWAEVKVQRAQADLPISIFRPGIVVGDSQTGETVKGDGPYMVVQLLQRLPRWVPMVHLGASRAPVNLVPVDFVVSAMRHLSADPSAAGKVFQLADPAPITAREILELTVGLLHRAPVVATVPAKVGFMLDGIGPVRRWAGLPRETMEYFNHHVEYDVTNTATLLDGKLACPRFVDYWPTLVDFATRHPEIFKRAA